MRIPVWGISTSTTCILIKDYTNVVITLKHAAKKPQTQQKLPVNTFPRNHGYKICLVNMK